MNQDSPAPQLHWDIFCRVIDNFGDLGVAWRLACNLTERGQAVRLWADDISALAWMAPQGAPGVEVRVWTAPIDMTDITPGDVLIETFGCDIDSEFIVAYAKKISNSGQSCAWINQEYLSAEAYAARCHGLPSPVMSGPGRGLTKHFYYPGFTADTGGLLREPDLMARQAEFDRQAWLARQGVPWQGERLVSLFCYEPAGLGDLLDTLANGAQPTRILVTHGRANTAVRAEVLSKTTQQPRWNSQGLLSFFYLPQLSQVDYDHLLWASDVNFVRGEDSLVRALWAGRPFIWQIYPQHDAIHAHKLAAFLDWLQAPDSLRAFHQQWNGLSLSAATPSDAPFAPADWQGCATRAKARLLQQGDLTTQLLGFSAKIH
ncbi:elongation factor P maturation arginine rhamnosyltransferase EarP [Rhodoferax sp.]|uniref:elongation factor P maturation arginine rhamnosyltransferase EarP n=1 Tax=Rhodoferax sp. TaxID=50421 RepID=UPI002625B83B|nr:elongation factor P maturation arginine rhamnosyltransferase EarP [Rhodoferax sp.]MDD2919069.1 elongation factor P maturation arginine rhamnosyltransferase EarP [Rhodoferax sp.]